MRPRSASERTGRHAQNLMGIRRRFTANSILIGALAKFVAVQCRLQPVMSTAAFLFHIQARLKRSHLSYKWSPKNTQKKQTAATKRECRAPRKSMLFHFIFFPKFYFFPLSFSRIQNFYANFIIRVCATWCVPWALDWKWFLHASTCFKSIKSTKVTGFVIKQITWCMQVIQKLLGLG